MTNPQGTYYPNILAIAGTGRKVGKTTLACNIIRKMGQRKPITAIKISPHFHEVDYPVNILEKPGEYTVYIEDRRDRNKDSSKMLAAGADRVYYVQSLDKNLTHMWNDLSEMLEAESPVVIESGGISSVISPGISFLVTKPEHNDPKLSAREENTMVISATDDLVSIVNRIGFSNGQWIIDKK